MAPFSIDSPLRLWYDDWIYHFKGLSYNGSTIFTYSMGFKQLDVL